MTEITTEKLEKIVSETLSEILGGETEKRKKPEHMTTLRGDEMVYKDHPRIAFRGAIDSLESEMILVQVMAGKQNLPLLVQDLQEIIGVIRGLLRCEVSGEPVTTEQIQGLTMEELREHSHHPSRYYGMKHFLPTWEHGEITAWLNRLRTKARETELIAYKAFKTDTGEVTREDIIRVLNRLSSLFWIMMIKYLTGRYQG
jgi:ethanolamine utilization cobalamin adenosyltransferase